jgi:SAM-dependent methyltransferase
LADFLNQTDRGQAHEHSQNICIVQIYLRFLFPVGYSAGGYFSGALARGFNYKMSGLSHQLTLAEQADRHHLYELSVQCSEAEIDFIDATYRRLRGRRARSLREDFCGTANVCCEWVKRRASNRAYGIDIDQSVLDWGRVNNLSRLSDAQRSRLELRREDVLKANTAPSDVILAMNFSYWLFTERKKLKRYFRSVKHALAEDGIFFIDAYGGYDAFRVIEEERLIDADGWHFTYIWEQQLYEPISGRLLCNIHFAFPDGSRLDQAFCYDWRLWTLPEIRELLTEAGFRRVTVYWQGWDADGEADGNFQPAEQGEAEAGWICYLTAEK